MSHANPNAQVVAGIAAMPRSSPAIALVIQLLVALLAIVVASAGRVKQVLPSDEVDPCTDLQQQGSSMF